MYIPKVVKILYKNYKVEERADLHEGNEELLGQIQYLEEKILPREGTSEQQKKATLCHEIIHGLDDMYCIGLKEKQVEKLGNALYMLILDNSEMFGEG